MRPSRNRILTVLPLVILITLSFLIFSAEGSSSDVVARHARHFASRRSLGARQQEDGQDDNLPDNGTSVSASSSSSSESTTTSSSSTSSTRSPSVTSTTSTTDSSSSTVSTSSSTSTTTSTSSSVIPSTTRSSSSSTPSSTSSSTTSSTFTSTSISTSTSSSQILPSSPTTTSSSTRSSSQITSSTTSSATTVIIATNVQSRVSTSSTSRSSSSTIVEASSSETASSKGFLSNSGAMAGTFTALGLVVVGIIAAAVIIVRKRKRSEELDIFDTEYKEYSGGNDLGGSGDNGASDTTSLSANAVSHAGAYNAEPNLNRVDYGFGPPPAVGTGSNRSSVASNHAGYGAFRSAAEQRKPPMQSSNLRTATTWSSDAAYAEPAVDENQSIHIVPNDDYGTYYTDAVRAPGLSH